MKSDLNPSTSLTILFLAAPLLTPAEARSVSASAALILTT
jgi:hypothetical protein